MAQIWLCYYCHTWVFQKEYFWRYISTNLSMAVQSLALHIHMHLCKFFPFVLCVFLWLHIIMITCHRNIHTQTHTHMFSHRPNTCSSLSTIILSFITTSLFITIIIIIMTVRLLLNIIWRIIIFIMIIRHTGVSSHKCNTMTTTKTWWTCITLSFECLFGWCRLCFQNLNCIFFLVQRRKIAF